MDISVKSQKTGKLYNITLGGGEQRLMVRLCTLLGLTGSLTVLTAMSFFATGAGRPYSQEICLAFAVGTLIAGKRTYTLYGEVKKMLNMLVAKHESEHGSQ